MLEVNENISEYNGYELEFGVYNYDLSERDKLVLDSAIFFVENNMSVRKCAENFYISKTSQYNYLRYELPKLSIELYRCVNKRLNLNKYNKKVV